MGGQGPDCTKTFFFRIICFGMESFRLYKQFFYQLGASHNSNEKSSTKAAAGATLAMSGKLEDEGGWPTLVHLPAANTRLTSS